MPTTPTPAPQSPALARADLAKLSATNALRVAGFGHRRAADGATTQRHDIFRLDSGEVVASMTAFGAVDFAAAALGIEAA